MSTVEPMILPLEAMMQDFLEKVLIDGASTEMVSKISTKGCSKKDPTEIARMKIVVDNLEKDLMTMMETGGSLKIAILVGHFLTSTAHAGPSDLTPRAPSTGEII